MMRQEGRTLGSYHVLEQIGMGGMATIYKAYDPTMDRYVAVKVLPDHYSQDPKFQKRFEREARAIARLEHPHILPVYAYGQEENTPYLVMRYVTAGTLKECIERGPLSTAEIVSILDQIADALDYAHDHGVLHRDVKPSNILMDEKGNTYLTDFGIAKMVEASIDLTGGGILGTPAYMSPEQCIGGQELTPASDQYSLGVILYEMITGKTPYQAETPVAIISMQVTAAPVDPPRSIRPDLPEAAEAVILKALAREPEHRFPNNRALVEVFINAIQGIDLGQPAQASGVTHPESPTFDLQPPSPAARPRVPIWGWGILGLIVIAGLIVGLLTLKPFGGTRPEEAVEAGSSADTQPTGITSPTQIPPSLAQPAVEQPTLTTQPAAAQLPTTGILYDDFDNPAYDLALDSTRWEFQPDCRDDVLQQSGTLVGLAAGDIGSCTAIVSDRSHVSFEQLGIFEAQQRIASDYHGNGDAWQSILFTTDDIQGGFWWAECGLAARPGGAISGEFNVQNAGMGTMDGGAGLPAEFDRWYTFRLVADPETAAFSCYMDDALIGSIIPADADALRGAQFERVIQTWRAGTATTYTDNVRIIPGGADADDQPTPLPSEPMLYDDFSDPAYDGSLNTDRWQVGSEATVMQQDGMLKVTLENHPAFGAQLTALPYNGFMPQAPVIFGADIMLDGTQNAGTAQIFITAFPGDNPSPSESTWWSLHFGISGEDQLPYATVNCYDEWGEKNDILSAYNIPTTEVQFNSWHAFRVEIDPAAMALTYYLDDQEIDSHIVDNVQDFRDLIFVFSLEVYTPGSDPTTGYFDNIYIGFMAR